MSNRFDMIFILRFIINIYIGYNRDSTSDSSEQIFFYKYIIIYLKNIFIEMILIMSEIESNIIINPIIMSIGDIIGKLLKNKKKYINNNSNNNIEYDWINHNYL